MFEAIPSLIKWPLILATFVGLMWFIWWQCIDDEDEPVRPGDQFPNDVPRIHHPLFYVFHLRIFIAIFTVAIIGFSYLAVKELPPNWRDYALNHNEWLKNLVEKYNENIHKPVYLPNSSHKDSK